MGFQLFIGYRFSDFSKPRFNTKCSVPPSGNCFLNPKGRFLLPSGFKKQLPEGGTEHFVLNRGFEKSLNLYPMKSWKPIFSEISNLNDFDPKVRQFRRYFLN